jgi:hypothetical protein
VLLALLQDLGIELTLLGYRSHDVEVRAVRQQAVTCTLAEVLHQ